jgi:hypothetical protein
VKHISEVLLFDIKKFRFSQQLFSEDSNINLYKKSSSDSQVDECGQLEGHVMKLVSGFCDFANAPNIWFMYIALNIEVSSGSSALMIQNDLLPPSLPDYMMPLPGK